MLSLNNYNFLTDKITGLRALMRQVEVDRAVAYGVLLRIWNLLTVPVTMILIASHFTPELQGYYYIFASVLTLQVFGHLGLGTVIIQFASHEWSQLRLDNKGRITGDADALSRLVNLGITAFRWYLTAAIFVAVGLGYGGYLFFSQSAHTDVDWIAPWLVLCLLTSLTLWLSSVSALLEGCNQVANVYAFRVFSGIINNLSVWVAIMLGAGLWTAIISTAANIACTVFFLIWFYQPFFRPFFSRPEGARISWRFDVWPMQWRIAISYASGYFINNVFIPIVFHYQGPIVAGQLGMTMNLVYAPPSFSAAWLNAKAPRFGMLIAQKDYVELDRLFFRVTAVSVGLLCFGSVAIWFIISILNFLSHPLAIRVLSPLPSGLLLLAMVAHNSTNSMAVYLRAHKIEPFMALTVLLGLLTGLITWFTASHFGPTGVAAGCLGVSALVALPLGVVIWYRCRAVLHCD